MIERLPLGARLALLAVLTSPMALAADAVAAPTPGGIMLLFLGHLVMASALAPVSMALPWPWGARTGAMFGLIYLVMFFNPGLELIYFTTWETARIARHFILGLVAAALHAGLAAALFPPSRTPFSTIPACHHEPPGAATGVATSAANAMIPARALATAIADLDAWLRSRSLPSWSWRFAAGVVVYVALYVVAGATVFPFVEPYYTDPTLGLGLVLPSGPGLIVRLQLVRGAIFLVALVPVLAGSTRSPRTTALLCGWGLYALGSLGPLLGVGAWPIALRTAHAIEMLFQNFLTGLAAERLLRRRRE